jgi:L-threonylcarbamoyladenylate synthase
MRDAVEYALSGKCIVYPTTTQPALGCLPEPAALDTLYELKQRPADMPVSIGVTSLEQAAALVEVPPDVHSILADFPEGSLTVVLRAHKTLDARLGGDNVAIRVVAHPVAKELLAITGPLTATSANRSGEAPVSDCDKAAQLLSASGEGGIGSMSGTCPGEMPSTLIAWHSVYGSTELSDTEVFREGVVSKEEILIWLKRRI